MATLPEPDSVVGTWVVDRWVAAGASADVLLVHDSSNPARIGALKWYRHDPKSRQTRDNEVHILSRCQHPGIVALLDSGETGHTVWLVTAWAEGRPLDAVMTSALPPDRVAAVAAPIAAAIAYAHSHGISHGDLKPSNIRISREGRTTVLDFGSAADIEESASRAATPRYAPPEWFGHSEADPRAGDVYALGVILHELFTGNAAFPRASMDALAEQKRRGPIDNRASHPPRFGQLVRQCTAVDPAERPNIDLVAARLNDVATEASHAWFSHTAGLAVSRTAELPGSQRYAIIDELGRGGMGVVWRAWDEQLMRYVALKRPPKGVVDEARFIREARLAARLNHRGVARIFDVDRDDEGLFYTMELIEGITLRERLQAGAMHPHTAASIVKELAESVQHAHDMGLIHRDLKPANVMLEPSGRPRLVDFGLARPLNVDLSRLTQTGALLGTPSYMAPEQMEGRDSGTAADVFALGAMLFRMVTGETPHQAETAAEIIHRRTHEPAQRVRVLSPEAPPELEAICAAALEADPANRTASAGALAADLERYVTGDPVRALTLGPTRRSYLWLRRNRTAVAGVAAIVVALALVGAAGVLVSQWVGSQANVARQTSAQARWDVLSAELTTLRDQGRDDAADLAFRSFIDDPDVVGTKARVHAWLFEGDRLEAADHLHLALDATANAWLQSTSPETLVLVAQPLQQRLIAVGEGDGAAQVGGELAALLPNMKADPHVIASRQRSLLLDRRMTEAAQLGGDPTISALAAAMTPARRLPFELSQMEPYDHDGDGRPELLVRRTAPPRTEIRGRSLQMPLLVDLTDATTGYRTASPAALIRSEPDKFGIKSGQDQSWRSLAHADVPYAGIIDPTDSKRILAVRNVSPARLLSWTADDGTIDLYPPIASHGGILEVITAADFAHDPRPEIAVAPAHWGGFELNILTPDDDGPHAYRLIERRPMGYITGLQSIVRPGNSTWLAVSKSGQYGSRSKFPQGNPYGEPLGLYLMSVSEKGTSTEHFFPSKAGCHGVFRADLDGNGWDEAYANCDQLLRVAAPTPDGKLSSFAVHGLVVLGVIDIDQNGDDELVVRLLDDGSTWVVGAGAGRFPGVPPRPTVQGPERELAAVAQAMSLARAGLSATAAKQIVSLARSDTDPRQREQLFASAAQFYIAANHPTDAEAILAEGAQESLKLSTAYADFLESRGRLHEAAAVRRQPVEGSAGHPPWTIAFDEPELHPSVAVQSAWQARTNPANGTLTLNTHGVGDILSVALAQGPRVRAQVDLTIESVEWSSAFHAGLYAADERMEPARWGVTGRGGARLTHAYLGCSGIDAAAIGNAQPFEGEAKRMRIILRQEGQRTSCQAIDLDTGQEVMGRTILDQAERPDRLQFGGGKDDRRVANSRIVIERITIEGAGPGSPEQDPANSARRALTEGRPSVAAAAWKDGADLLTQLIINSDLGDPTQTDRLLQRAVRQGREADLAAALATGRYGWMDSLRRQNPQRWPEIWANAYFVRIISRGPHLETDRLLTAGLDGIELVQPRTNDELDTVGRLLLLRAEAFKRAGSLPLASRALLRAKTLLAGHPNRQLVAAVDKQLSDDASNRAVESGP